METVKYNISDEVLKRKTLIKGKIIDIFPDGKNSVFYIQFENDGSLQKCTENDIQDVLSKQIPKILKKLKQNSFELFNFLIVKYNSNPKLIKILKILGLIMFGFYIRCVLQK